MSDSSESSLSDLVKFNTSLAHTHYKVSDVTSLETLLYTLQPEKDIEVIVITSVIILITLPALPMTTSYITITIDQPLIIV